LIGATLVLYKPDIKHVKTLLASLLRQVDVVSIIDNSPTATPLSFDAENIHYHHFSNNVGVAVAHNIGIRDLISAQCDYAMLVDQDSHIKHDMVQRLSQHLILSKEQSRPLVAIGPRIICSFSEKTVKPRVQKEIARYEDMVCVSQIISSGMMIDLSKVDLIGPKDERLFIDGVDHEWCWRARKNKLDIGIAENIEMVHRLGDARSKFVGITYKVGSPIRLYYQFRNVFLLFRRSYVPSYWKLRNLCVLPIRFFANGVLQKKRIERIKFMLKGLCDGFLGRTGKYNDNW